MSDPDLNTREGRLQALRSTGLLTPEEYEFAVQNGLDITDNIAFRMAKAADEQQRRP